MSKDRLRQIFHKPRSDWASADFQFIALPFVQTLEPVHTIRSCETGTINRGDLISKSIIDTMDLVKLRGITFAVDPDNILINVFPIYAFFQIEPMAFAKLFKVYAYWRAFPVGDRTKKDSAKL